MSDMIERVARALYIAWWAPRYGPPDEWEAVVAEDPEMAGAWRASARAAIEAMREPSLKMVAEAVDNVGPIGCCTHSPETAIETWQAMISAALAAQKPSS